MWRTDAGIPLSRESCSVTSLSVSLSKSTLISKSPYYKKYKKKKTDVDRETWDGWWFVTLSI